MKLKSSPLLWIGTVTLAAILLISMLHMRQNRTNPQPSKSPALPVPIASTSQQEHSRIRQESGPLPWQQSFNASKSNSGSSPSKSNLQATNRPLNRTQLMASMQSQLQRNQITVDAALKRIAEVQASGTAPAGVDLNALRNSLQISKQAQSLAMKLVEVSGERDTPERRQRIADITDELQAIQAQLQQEMTLPPAPETNAITKAQ